MRAIQALRRGDLEDAANLSFDCISCGACSIRCPAEITHYQAFQFARRLYGKYETIPAKHLMERVKEIEDGKFKDEMVKLIDMTVEELKKLYTKREIEK